MIWHTVCMSWLFNLVLFLTADIFQALTDLYISIFFLSLREKMSFSTRHPGWRCFITSSLMEIREIVMNSKLLNNVSGHRYYGFFMLLITVIVLSSLKCSWLVFVYIKLIFSLFKRQKKSTFRDREDVAHTWDYVFSPGCCFSMKNGENRLRFRDYRTLRELIIAVAKIMESCVEVHFCFLTLFFFPLLNVMANRQKLQD